MKILFICSSNICRSPYCEFMFKRMLKDYPELSQKIDWVKSSAVLNKSKAIHPKAILALKREGFDEETIKSHNPSFKWLDMKRFRQADLIIGMSKFHRFMTPIGCKHKYMSVSEFAGEGYKQVVDPYLMKDINDYYAVMDTLKGYLEKGIKRLADGEL